MKLDNVSEKPNDILKRLDYHINTIDPNIDVKK